MKILFAFAMTCVLLQSTFADDPLNTLTDAEKAAGWTLLFDGTDTSQWRNYQKEEVGEGWKIVDGAIVRSAKNAGDLITRKQFEAFELQLDFKISKSGNSGLMYHVTETEKRSWHTGPEIQIQDNDMGRDPQKTGWLYALYKTDVDVTKPTGEWNSMRILITPEKCEHHLNGEKYVEYVKGSDDWKERVAKSKFSKHENFGVPTKGHICLQDHGSEVAFRNIKIRVVK